MIKVVLGFVYSRECFSVVRVWDMAWSNDGCFSDSKGNSMDFLFREFLVCFRKRFF